ncbi:BamA/TamA family outer membrane protein, partial [bacterium]|nr:BamA/TamA family outer membrane protein [bacterium]
IAASAVSPAPVAPAGGRSVASLLRDRWLARGYLACVVTRLETAEGSVFTVAPGAPYTVGEIVVTGEDFPGRDAVLARALPRRDDPFGAEAWAAAIDRLLVMTGEAGYPFSRWLVRDVRVDSVRAAVDVGAILMTGPVAYFGPQASNLPEGRGEDFLVRASRLPVGRRYRESDLRAARARLMQRDIYADVGRPVVFTTAAPGTVGVHWPVTPVPRPNRVALMLGLSRTGADEPARVSGQADLHLANLAGSGRRLELAWSDDGRARSHFGFGWLEPLLWGTPFDATVDVDHEVATDVYTRFRVDSRLKLPVAGAWEIEVGLGWDRSTFPVGAWSRTTRWRTRGAFLHRRRDRGANGWQGTFAIESARRGVDARPVDDPSAGVTPGEESQTLVEMRLSGERWLTGTLSLAVGGMFQEVNGRGGEIPLAEQYRLGGARTLRGYLEDQFHGERVASSMVELRIGRPGRSRLYTFFDVGYFRFAGADPARPARLTSVSGSRRGFGLGIETATRGGDISLAIGLPGAFQFDDAKLHIALLQAF